MKIKFTKASQTDHTLVTVSLSQLDGTEYEIVRSMLRKDENICLDIEGQPVIFAVNRVRKGRAITAVTHCYPRFLRLPSVGHPVYAEVSQVS